MTEDDCAIFVVGVKEKRSGYDSIKIAQTTKADLRTKSTTALAKKIQPIEQSIKTAASLHCLQANAILDALVNNGLLGVKGANDFAKLYGERIFTNLQNQEQRGNPNLNAIQQLETEMAGFCEETIRKADKIADHTIKNIQTFTPYPKVSPMFQQFE